MIKIEDIKDDLVSLLKKQADLEVLSGFKKAVSALNSNEPLVISFQNFQLIVTQAELIALIDTKIGQHDATSDLLALKSKIK